MSRMLSPSSGKPYGLARVCPDLALRESEHLPPPPAGASAAEAGSCRSHAGRSPSGTNPRRPLR
jgi:hypothetical protein